jgi:hypothetical protein
MRQKRPFVLAKKDKITKEWLYVANQFDKSGASPELTGKEEDALKFDTIDEASDELNKIGKPGKGFEIRKI